MYNSSAHKIALKKSTNGAVSKKLKLNSPSMNEFQTRSRLAPPSSFSEKMLLSPGRKVPPPPPLSIQVKTPPSYSNHPLPVPSSSASSSHQSWEVAMVPLRNQSSMKIKYSTKGPVPKLKSSDSAVKIYYEYNSDDLDEQKFPDDCTDNGSAEAGVLRESTRSCCCCYRQKKREIDPNNLQKNQKRRMNCMFRNTENFNKVCVTVSYFTLGILAGLLLIIGIAYFLSTE